MWTTLFGIVQYAYSVKRLSQVPPTALVARMGVRQSDQVSIKLDEIPGVSLQDYQESFMRTLLFSLLVYILSWFTPLDASVTRLDHLQTVAAGDQSTYGPFTAWAAEGNKQAVMSAGEPSSASQIMRCFIKGKTNEYEKDESLDLLLMHSS
jgi:hypothetical protein